MYSVYRHTTPNGKVYIGITQQEPEVRWRNGHGYKNNVLFKRAIEKYGWDNIKHEVLYTGLTKQEAFRTEERLIAEHRSNQKEFGYHLTAGGANAYWFGRKREKAWGERCRAKWIGASNPNARQVICLETLKVYETATQAQAETGATKICKCCKRSYKHRTSGGYHWAYYDGGDKEKYRELLRRYIEEESTPRVMTESERQAIAERCSIPVMCVETNEVFASIADASVATGAAKPNICKCCKGIRKTAAGYHWKYAEEVMH